MSRNRLKDRLEKAQEAIEEGEAFAQDYEEGGIKEALGNKAGDILQETIETAIGKALGSDLLTSALIETIKESLPDAPITRGMTTDELVWFEEKIREQTQESYEDLREVWDLQDIGLEEIVEDELQEIEDIIEQLDEKDLEEIVDDLEKEILEEDEVDTDEYEQEIEGEEKPKKCHSITLRTRKGEKGERITFNTCDEMIEEKEESPYKPADIEESPDNPPFPSKIRSGLLCPIHISTTVQISQRSDPLDRRLDEQSNQSAYYILGWWNPSEDYEELANIYPKTFEYMFNSRFVHLNYKYYSIYGSWEDPDTPAYKYLREGNTDFIPPPIESSNPNPYSFADSTDESVYLHYKKDVTHRIYYTGKGGFGCVYHDGGNPPPDGFKPEKLIKYPEMIMDNKDNECCLATLSLLRKVSHVTGISEVSKYPGEMPEKLTDENTPTTTINDLTDWQLYHFDVLDEIVGQFPIDFKIEGDEAKPDNIAEALAEIYGMLLDVKVDAYEDKMVTARALTEIGLARLTIARIFRYLEETVKYLEFDYQDGEEEVQLTFNPLAYEDKDNDGNLDKDSLEEFLTESKQKIKIIKEGKDSLRNDLEEIRQAAQIIKAMHWHKIPGEPVAAKNNLLNLLNLGSDVAKDFAQYRGDSKKGWENFKENVEENWREKTGKLDDDRDDNPRIKDLK